MVDVGAALAATDTSKLSVVVVPKVFVNVIVEDIVSPEPVNEPLKLFVIVKLPLLLIEMAALEEAKVPD